MSWINYDDVRLQLEAAGLILRDELRVDTTRPVRVKTVDSREKRGWYALKEITLDGGDRALVGAYGYWTANDNHATQIKLNVAERKRLTPLQAQALRARVADDKRRAEAERMAEGERAAMRAAAWWAQCEEGGEHPYVKRKGLPHLMGARLSAAGNLVIPMMDTAGKVWGLQCIYADPKVIAKKRRDKDFAPPGLIKRGHMTLFGSPMSGGVVLLAEGWATGASLHLATSMCVAVAFDAGNLMPVAEALRKRYKGVRLLVCADDDYLNRCRSCGKYTLNSDPTCAHCGADHGNKNTGIEHAQAVALAVSGAWVAPEFPADRPLDVKGPTDFNDLHVHPHGGLAAVRAQVEAALLAQGWAASATAPRGLDSGGGGETLRGLYTVEEAIDRWAVVYGGKGLMFDGVDRVLVAKTDVLEILPDHAAREMKIHPRRQVVRLSEVGFDPTGEDASVKANLWAGWPVQAVPGRCELILQALRYMCSHQSNASEMYEWLLRWMAYPLQNPGAKMQSAVILHGPQGVGKSMIIEDAYMPIFGKHAITINQAALEDKFNDWISSKLFLFADEVVARQDLHHVKNMLKNLVTCKTVRVNPKGLASYYERNHCNIVFCSNETVPLILEEDDRRHAVIWTPEKLPPEYYAGVKAEIAAGGVQAFYHHLLQLDLTDFHWWTNPPMSDAKRDLVEASMDSVDLFMRGWREESLPKRLPHGPVRIDMLHKAYLAWARETGVGRPREYNQFSARVKKKRGYRQEMPKVWDNRDCYGETRTARVLIPDDAAPPEGARRDRWITECIFKFKDVADAQ